MQQQAQAQAPQAQAQLVQALLQGQIGGPKRPAGKQKKRAGPAPTHLVPESPAVVQLGEVERKVDLLLKRRRLEVQAVTSQEPPLRKKVRVYITHKHWNQPGQGSGGGGDAGSSGDGGAPRELPRWSLSLSGRVDPDSGDPMDVNAITSVALQALQQGGQAAMQAAAAAAARQGAAAHPFTVLWRRITITLRHHRGRGQQQQQDGSDDCSMEGEEEDEEEVVVWEKSRHKGGHKEEVQVMRIGTAPVSVTVRLEPDNTPPRFRLPPALAKLLGTPHETRVGAARSLDRILRERGMVTRDKPPRLVPPPDIAEALGLEEGTEIDRAELIETVVDSLEPMGPVVLSYEIDLSGPSPSGATHCFDFTLDMPTKVGDRPHPALEAQQAAMEKELEEHDRKLQQLLVQLGEARRRRTMLLGFAQEPAEFIDAVSASLSRDLRAATGAGAVVNGRQVFETPRRSEAFSGGWVEEAVLKHLLRKRNEHQAAVMAQQQAAMLQAQAQIAAVQKQLQAQQQGQQQQQQQQQPL